ncbi:glycosyltransferase family 4 protein [Bythopirellula polymerisocia]|uniref:Capsular glucan synthase n=1 Tax=Bythopirellula polymerisocia TaxID=2528003 RepID=A0A5C6CWE9_9BACT|nr:glycosyltransferase family 4 protein [Bythopirellula polymerisocia]TWU28185.1 Capsular glucan synthase [Bythopirellula polymerisocia]
MNHLEAIKHDRPLTVVQILPALESGGVERGTLEVSAALVERGHRSIVVSAGGRLVEKLQSAGGEHIMLDLGKKSPLTLLQAGKLRRVLQHTQADLVHVRSRMPAWVTLLAWKRMRPESRPRLVTTVHGLNSVNWYSKVMTYGELVIAVSNCCRDYILKNYPNTDPSKVLVIHRGVDAQDFPYDYRPDEAWTSQWNVEFPQLAGKFVVLLPGRLTRFKGHFDFLQAISKLRPSKIPVHGLIVGGVDPRRRQYAESLHSEVTRLGLLDSVTFTGHRSDLREIMCVSDVVVSTSIKPPESFGRTVLEAVKLGRPTLGYDHGGVGEVLGKVYPQGRVPLEDTDAMAEKISAVYRGELPPPEPTNEFDLPTLLAKEIDLYEELVEQV